MSIQTEIDRINTSVAAAYEVLEGLGATMPTAQTVDNLAATAATIPKPGCRVNLLDNSDFCNPVNQRGSERYTSGYACDRWRVYNATTVVEIGSGCISISGTEVGLWQVVPNVGSKVYTFAARLRNGETHFAVGTFEAGAISPSGLLHFNNSSVGMSAVCLGAGEWIWAALYEGEYTANTLPVYQPKGYGAELAECQRHYRRIGATNRNTVLAVGIGYTESAMYIPIQGIQMRGAYSVNAVTDISTIKTTNTTLSNAVAVTGLTAYNAHDTAVSILVNGTFVRGTPYTVWLNNGVIEISAEL